MLNKLRTLYINSSLRKKIIILISLFITLTPTALVAALSIIYYKFGIEALLNEQISASLHQTVEIADLYLKEHKENIRSDILAIERDLDRNSRVIKEDPSLLQTFVDKQAEIRNLAEVIIFQKDRIIAKNSFALSFQFLKLSDFDLSKTINGEVTIITDDTHDKVRAIVKLDDSFNTYLLVGMYIDKNITKFVESSKGYSDEYNKRLSELRDTKFHLKLGFAISAIVLCIIAIFFGRKLAEVITAPLNELVEATLKLKHGDFSIKLAERKGKDETAILARAFNQMTAKLSDQHTQLVRINAINEERRRFIEKVLLEVSAGVIYLSPKKKPIYINQSVHDILKLKKIPTFSQLLGLIPDLQSLIESAENDLGSIQQLNIKAFVDNKIRHFYFRVSAQIDQSKKIEGFVITFDDITELISIQRMSAWADVARRVAHEIKNPLTPISLAAERLAKKFSSQITKDKPDFDKYVLGISRHVSDIQRIVEEFINFARIPTPVMSNVNISKLLEELSFSQNGVFDKIDIKLVDESDKQSITSVDVMQMTQVVLNLVKNAAESIHARMQEKNDIERGIITIEILPKNSTHIIIKISDNGLGIDNQIMEKIFEPYVTSKSGGMGLGLSIVKKILEDHSSMLQFENSPNGATFYFILTINNSRGNDAF